MQSSLQAFIDFDLLIRDPLAFVESMLSVRLLRMVLAGTLVTYAVLLYYHMSQLLVKVLEPRPEISPHWRIFSLALLTANLHLRMAVLN